MRKVAQERTIATLAISPLFSKVSRTYEEPL